MKYFILLLLIFCVAYVMKRGKVKHSFWRQLSDHSTFTAPINVFMYLFSKVPTTPYIDVNLFPELNVLKEHWEMIREEGIKLTALQKIAASKKLDDIGFNSFFRTGWKRFYLKWYKDNHPSAETLCPKTTVLLRSIPSIKAALFAELPHGAHLPHHRDPYAGSLRYHLGLVTPNDDKCYLNVDGEIYSWRDGVPVMFDETYIHYAENQSGKDRLILLCDIARPMKFRWAQAINDWIGNTLLSAATAPNDDTQDRTGKLNTLFNGYYKIRIQAKRLKAWNMTTYYICKWIIFAGIPILIFYFI